MTRNYMYALLTFLLSLSFVAFGCNSSMSYDVSHQINTMQQVISLRNEVHTAESSFSSYMNGETACFSPQSSSSTLPFSTSLSVEISNDKKVAVTRNSSHQSELFPEVERLYKNGEIKELEKMGNAITLMQWLSNQHLRMKKEFIAYLLKDENKTHLENLARIAAIHSPRTMRRELVEYLEKNKRSLNPVHACEAIILADRKTGGGNIIKNDMLPRKVYPISESNMNEIDKINAGRDFVAELREQMPQAENLITLEMAKYAVERYLPEMGTSLTPEVANEYIKNVLIIADYVPGYQKKDVFTAGILGFYTRFLDPKGTVKAHKDAVWNVSNALANGVIKVSAGDVRCIPQSIVDLHHDIHWMINDCPREVLAFRAGERLADALYLIAYYSGVRAAIQGVSCVQAMYLGAETTGAAVIQNAGKVAEKLGPEEAALITKIEEIAPQELADKIVQQIIKEGECQLTKGKGLTHNYACRVKPGQDPSQIIKQLEHFGPLRNIAKDGDKGEVLLRMMNQENKLVYRQFSKSFKNAPEPVPTIEYQRGDLSVKLRYAYSEQMLQDILSGKYE